MSLSSLDDEHLSQHLMCKQSESKAFSLTLPMASAVLTGTVDFSTTILLEVDTEAIRRAAPSQ
jgi:hypothetical protein